MLQPVKRLLQFLLVLAVAVGPIVLGFGALGKDPEKSGLPVRDVPDPHAAPESQLLYAVTVRAWKNTKTGKEFLESEVAVRGRKPARYDWHDVGYHLLDKYRAPPIVVSWDGNQPPKLRRHLHDVVVETYEGADGKPQRFLYARQTGIAEDTPPLEPQELADVGQFIIEKNIEPPK